jgi:very-short-patch-repair endonuclease
VPDEPIYDPTAVPRVLDRATALRLGYTDEAIEHQVRVGRWQRVLPHTYLTIDTVTWNDRLLAAVAFAGQGAMLSGAAALCDRGLVSVKRPERVLVLVPPGRQPRSVEWVRVRPSERPMRRGLSPGPARAAEARAACDFALERRYLDDVRALVAEVVRKKLCTVDELAFELRHGPQRGSAHLRQAIDEVGAGAWSAPEARAATLLRRAGVLPFEQNVRIDLPGGRFVIVDFLWRSLRAVLEIDSDAHHSLAGDADRTSDRHLLLATAGFSTIHRTPRQVLTMPRRFTADVANWLAARGEFLSTAS